MSALSPGGADVDLWYVLPRRPPAAGLPEEYRRLLSPDELARERRFTLDKVRHQWLVTRVLARTVLARYAGCDPRELVFASNDFGKPLLAEPADLPLSFSLSRTGGCVTCAVASGCELGVDVEDVGRSLEHLALAERFFAPAESAAIARAAPRRQRIAFFEFWTLKEAYVKARGMGLSIPLRDFAFSLSESAPPAVSFSAGLGDDPARWQFAQIRLRQRYQIALAARLPKTPHPKIRIRQTLPLEQDDAGHVLPPSRSNRWRV